MVVVIIVTIIISAIYSSIFVAASMISARKENEYYRAMFRLVKTIDETVQTIDIAVDNLVELQQKMELRKKYPMPIEMEEITDETLR